MSPQTLKMFVMFLMAAALLNVTNYLFYWLYDPPARHAMRVEFQVSEHTKFLRLITNRHFTRIPKWSDFLLCENNNSSATPMVDRKTPDDYREQHGDSKTYDYNAVKKEDNMCPVTPPAMGLDTNGTITPQEIDKLYDILAPGGIYKETECMPRQSVAIIVAFRYHHREHEHRLHEFLYSMHPFLMKQQLEYQIFVVKQSNKTTPFNPGRLFNVGFTEAQGLKKNEWRCIVFHEHTIVPVDSRNLYRCLDYPQQLVTNVGNRSYDYEFGGAIAVNPRQFLKVNGFSNVYQMYYDSAFQDLYQRFKQANYTPTRSSYGIFKPTKYCNKTYNNKNHQTMQTSSPLHLIDGLSTLSYTLNLIDLKPLYTLIDVDLYKPQINSTNMWEKILSEALTSTTLKMQKNPFVGVAA